MPDSLLSKTDGARALIVNADDFGQSAGINRGIAESHERGIVTSASLMVLWPASAAAAAYARSQPALSVGLHVDLGEWMCRRGTWEPVYERVDIRDADAVKREIWTQLDRHRDLLGCDPTHLDSHQHVHRKAPVQAVLERVSDELGVPLRHCSTAIRHCGDFYGQSARGEAMPHLIATASLISRLRRLPDGVTELGCHPGYADDLDTMYREERTVELHTLCDNEIRQALADEEIRLVSFRDVQGR